MYFYYKKNWLITVGIDGCYIFKLDVACLYDFKLAVKLDPTGRSLTFKLKQVVKLDSLPDWVKGLHVNEHTNHIVAWSSITLCFYNLEPHKELFEK